MDVLLVALGPALAAGMALQRVLEVFDSWIEKISKGDAAKKRTINNGLAALAGLLIAWAFKLQVLRALGTVTDPNDALKALDIILTGFLISTGTESINSIVKFLGYKKEEKKSEAKTAAGAEVEGKAG